MSEICISGIFGDIAVSIDLSYWSQLNFISMDLSNPASG